MKAFPRGGGLATSFPAGQVSNLTGGAAGFHAATECAISVLRIVPTQGSLMIHHECLAPIRRSWLPIPFDHQCPEPPASVPQPRSRTAASANHPSGSDSRALPSPRVRNHAGPRALGPLPQRRRHHWTNHEDDQGPFCTGIPSHPRSYGHSLHEKGLCSEGDLWAAIEYVHHNPVAAGLAAEPKLYRWPSAGQLQAVWNMKQLQQPETARSSVVRGPVPRQSGRGAYPQHPWQPGLTPVPLTPKV